MFRPKPIRNQKGVDCQFHHSYRACIATCPFCGQDAQGEYYDNLGLMPTAACEHFKGFYAGARGEPPWALFERMETPQP